MKQARQLLAGGSKTEENLAKSQIQIFPVKIDN
jgi:hypothetical protein